MIKFGSSVLFDRTRFQAAVHEVYRAYRRGHQVLVVVSAIGHHTDRLLDVAHELCASPLPQTAVAQLLSTSEQQSAALFTIALTRAGIPCQLLDASSIGLVLKGDRLDVDPWLVSPRRILAELSQAPVAVLPGFIGRHEHGGMAVLGRGGSDLSAVFLADQLDARACRLVKDVDGVYDRDPAAKGHHTQADTPHRYGEITYADALRVAEVLIQPKGFAEADVSYDLSGQDSKDKLQLLARRAFGVESDSRPLVLKGISDIRRVEPPDQRSFDKGMRLKLVATFTATGPARVSPEWLCSDDYLAGTCEEENRLIITGVNGQQWRVSGKGAGRWPTAEAVLADLFDLHAAINAKRQESHTNHNERLDEPGDIGMQSVG